MTKVFCLWHIYLPAGAEDENEKLIGIYSTAENAEAVVRRLRSQPGFKDYPDGFQIHERTLDKDTWEEGFISVAEALREFDVDDK
jgi:hypothetical protein